MSYRRNATETPSRHQQLRRTIIIITIITVIIVLTTL